MTPKGYFDQSFGTSGFAISPVNTDGNGSESVSLSIDKKNRILVVTRYRKSGTILKTDGTAVIRYLPNGSLDKTFNSTGFIDLSNGTYCYDMMLDGKCRILLMTDPGLTLQRYKPSGRIDTKFGEKGKITVTGNPEENEASCGTAMTMDSTGRIIVSGQWRFRGELSLGLWRFSPDGSLDLLFGSEGRTTLLGTAGGTTLRPADIILDGKERIIVTGMGTTGNERKHNGCDCIKYEYIMCTWCFNLDGSPDYSFNDKGYVIDQIMNSPDKQGNMQDLTTENTRIPPFYYT